VRGTLLTVLHADWPAYPEGDDFLEGLFQLSAFPAATSFVAIDDIDRALLLAADVKGANFENPFAAKNFHIAIWHQDAAELQRRGFIEGIEQGTEQKWFENQWKEFQSKIPAGQSVGMRGPAGEFIPIKGPKLGQYDDDPDSMPFVVVPSGRIAVTAAGREFVRSTIRAQSLDIATHISSKAHKLFELGFFDTCVRDACVQLEDQIKKQIGSQAYGDKLLDAFAEHLRAKKQMLESDFRTFHQELRAVFKWIRNYYMHNLSEVDEASALVILVRISRVYSIVRGAAL
jgi:hypothetical protein